MVFKADSRKRIEATVKEKFPTLDITNYWSLVADNDSTKYEIIIKANSDIPITPVLESGIKLKIPVLEEKETISFITPPWKK